MTDSDVKRRTGHELRKIRDARTVPLSKRQTDLDRYKAIVIKGQRNFVETGTALGLIRRDNLFREDGYATFEAMVQNAFDMSTTTAYRLVEAARVVTILSQLGTRSTLEAVIKNQAQALALAPLVKDREAMARVLDTAAARADRLTADLITEVRIELYPATKVIDGESREGGRREIEAPPAAPRDSAPEPDAGAAACEACGAPLAKYIVAAAQYRCIMCDPERDHFAPDHGQPCVACDETATGALTSPVDGVPSLDASNVAPGTPAASGSGTESEPAAVTPTDSPAGQPLSPDVAEVTPQVAIDQPETKDHPSATGEARAEEGEARPGAGAQPADDAHTSAVDEPGGGMAVPPAGDPIQDVIDEFWAFSRFVDQLDVDVLGPLMTSDQLSEINEALARVTQTVGFLARWHAAGA